MTGVLPVGGTIIDTQNLVSEMLIRYRARARADRNLRDIATDVSRNGHVKMARL